MPSRIVREGIISSRRIDALSPLAEIFFRRLMSVADDYGRFFALPFTLAGSLWPLCPQRHSVDEIQQFLDECSCGKDPLILIYESQNSRYLEIQNFRQQRRSPSKFPDPSESKLLSVCLADDVHTINVSVSRSKSAPLTTTTTHTTTHTDGVGSLREGVTLEELELAWDRHAKHLRGEPQDLAFRRIVALGEKFDEARFRARHSRYCDFWSREGWRFCSLTFLGWIEAGMPEPPPDAKPAKRGNWTAESLAKELEQEAAEERKALKATA